MRESFAKILQYCNVSLFRSKIILSSFAVDEISGGGERRVKREDIGRAFSRKPIRHSSRWLFSYMLNGGVSLYTPWHLGLIICLIPHPTTSSFRLAATSFSPWHPLRRGSHLAALFSVPIVTGPSLSLVDVTRSTDTRSRSPFRAGNGNAERRVCSHFSYARLLVRKKVQENCEWGQTKRWMHSWRWLKRRYWLPVALLST